MGRSSVTRNDYTVSMSLDNTFCKHGFTLREKETAALLLEGLSNDAIAERMILSTATVKSYASGVYRKFNVKSRAEFIVKILKKTEGGA